MGKLNLILSDMNFESRFLSAFKTRLIFYRVPHRVPHLFYIYHFSSKYFSNWRVCNEVGLRGRYVLVLTWLHLRLQSH